MYIFMYICIIYVIHSVIVVKQRLNSELRISNIT